MKKITALFCAAAMLAALISCGESSNQGDGSGQMYNASLLTNPQSLDPQYASDKSSNTVIANLYSGLMRRDANGNIVNCNAVSYDVSADGLTYTFALREDNFWFTDKNDNDKIDDGEYFPVTSHDYAFALRRILDPEMHSPYAESFSCIKNGSSIIKGNISAEHAGIAAPNDYTLVIELEYPSADFINLLATNAAAPCNEEFFLSTKGRYGLDDDSVMSNGSFFVRQWFYDPYGKNNILYMKKNSVNSYESDRVYPSYLSFTIEREQADIAKLFKDKSIDCMTVMDRSAYGRKKYSLNSSRSVTLGIAANPADKVCSNANFRRALALSVDREAVGRQINDDVTMAYGIIPPEVKLLGRSYRELYDDSLLELTDEKTAVDCIDSAKRQLNMATFDTIKVLVSNETVDTSYLRVITQHWQDVLGVYIGIEEVSSDEFAQRLGDGRYQLALYPLSGNYNSGVSVLEAAVFDKFISFPESDSAIIDDIKRCADSSALVEKFSSAEKQLLSEHLFIPVFYKNAYLVMKSECEDIIYDSFSGAVNFREAKYFD